MLFLILSFYEDILGSILSNVFYEFVYVAGIIVGFGDISSYVHMYTYCIGIAMGNTISYEYQKKCSKYCCTGRKHLCYWRL